MATPSAIGAVIAAKGHVGHDQGATNCTANGACVVQHLVHGDGERVFVAQDDHGERVADEHEIDSGFIDEARGGIVVRGERGDGLALALHFSQCRHGDFCDRGIRSEDDRAAEKLVRLMLSPVPLRRLRMRPEQERVYAYWLRQSQASCLSPRMVTLLLQVRCKYPVSPCESA